MVNKTYPIAPTPLPFRMVLIGISCVICFNLARMLFRYFNVIREELLDEYEKAKPTKTKAIWYMEDAIKRDQARRRRKRIKEHK